MDYPKLRPYQIEDVNFLSKLNCAGCFNEQRTGKTPTALMTLKIRELDNSRILIVTTSSALYQWKDEYEKWLQKPCVVLSGSQTQKKRIKVLSEWTHGLICSLDTIKAAANRTGYIKEILKLKPQAVVLDEAHKIKNSSTKAAEAMYKLIKIPNRLALTGTPAYGKPEDIFGILHFLYPNEFVSIYKFRDYYLKKETIYAKDKIGTPRPITVYKQFKRGRDVELQNFLKTCCTQRKRKDVMPWLPQKDRQTIKLPITKEQTKYLEELKLTYQTDNCVTKGILDRLVRYRQICLDPEIIGLKGKSPKTQWILDFIADYPDTPVIIFSNFTEYLKKLFNILKENNVKEAMIIGEITPEKRKRFQTDFQNGKFNVFLINIKAGKEALTLDRAEAIIFTDVFPPIGDVEQAEDRFIATTEDKKDKPHAIFSLAIQNSYDENIIKLLQQRKTETDIINDFRSQLNNIRRY